MIPPQNTPFRGEVAQALTGAIGSRDSFGHVYGKCFLSRAKLIFIGVSTGASTIMRLFPRWADQLGLDCDIIGWDLPLRAPVASYRSALETIIADPAIRGALVTTHKIDLLAATRERFDSLDETARLCDEVSCIVKRDGKLLAFAKDPQASARALRDFLPPRHWTGGNRDVLCLGAGGAAIAISVALARANPESGFPRRMLLCDVLPERLAAIKRIHSRLNTPIQFAYHLSRSARDNDALLHEIPPGSLVINATGMGKDTPGSPLTAEAQFPRHGFVWELNYRGDREFMHQALAQASARRLHIEDGWNYFLRGWCEAIAETFAIPLNAETFRQLSEIAAAFRPR